MEYRQLDKVFIKDIGWKQVGYDDVIEIGEHPVNSWLKIVFKEDKKTWSVDNTWVIVRIYQ